MIRPCVYLHPAAFAHAQDAIPQYRDTTPFSHDGIRRNCKLCPRDSADLVYLGQVSQDTESQIPIPEFLGSTRPYVIDLEGGWPTRPASHETLAAIKSGNCARTEHNVALCVRPPMSTLLVRLAKEPPIEVHPPPSTPSFAFRGLPDAAGVRRKVAAAALNSSFGSCSDITCYDTPFQRPKALPGPPLQPRLQLRSRHRPRPGRGTRR